MILKNDSLYVPESNYFKEKFMKKLLYLLLLVIASVQAQVTLKVTSIPANTPAGSVLYVAGNFNSWNPSGTALVADGSGNYSCTIPEGLGSVEYKFTRGSWATVEGNASGTYLPNRTFTFNGSPQTLLLTILSWEDTGTSNPSTASVNVHIMSNAFFMPQLNRSRRIWIYLPPDYQTGTKTYPVIYMHDGQNLFDNATSFAGEWQVDETLNNLFNQGDYGAIVVGIDNGGTSRIDEYTPWNNPQYGGGEGDSYMQFVAETLKPYVDNNYRTKPQPEYTALIGSSLGALISTYGGIKYSKTFSKIGSFSPAYWIVSSQFNDFIAHTTENLSTTRIYFVAGQNESTTIASEINDVKNTMQSKGLTAGNTLVKLDAYGQHNESYWKGEFAAAYQWLFRNIPLNTSSTAISKPTVYVAKNQMYAQGVLQNSEAEIYDMAGKHIESLALNNGWNKLVTILPTGQYILKLPSDSIRFMAKE